MTATINPKARSGLPSCDRREAECRDGGATGSAQEALRYIAEGKTTERAAQMNALFVVARSTPFMNCECGQVIDFTLGECERAV